MNNEEPLRYWNNQEFGVIELAGPDSLDFLQRLTSQEFRNFKEGHHINGAVLTPTSQVIAFFLASYHQEKIYLLTPGKEAAGRLFNFLEKMHFAEDFTLKDVSQDFHHVVTFNGDTKELPGLSFEMRDLRILSFGSQKEKDEFVNSLKGVSEGNSQELDFIKALQGFPKWGLDFTEKNLVLEGPFDDFVSRNKGCYPGQEVVERVHTYGNVAKKLTWLNSSTENLLTLKPGDKIIAGDLEVGTVTSILPNAEKSQAVVTALVRKPHYKPETQVTVNGKALTVKPIPHSFQIEE